MKISRAWALTAILPLIACNQKLKDPLESVGADKTALAAPIINTVSYTQAGSVITRSSPFSTTIDMIADTGLGSCNSSQAQVTFVGQYDANLGTSIEIFGGVADVQTTLSNGSFTSLVCLPRGASLVKFQLVSSEGSKSSKSEISINVSAGIVTLAWGHPRYPSPGFRHGAAHVSGIQSSQGIDLHGVSVENQKSQIVTAAAQPSLTLQTNFLGIIGADQ